MGLIPTRLCRLLLPVWRADVQATIYDSEPYDLIDRYLEAAIAQGGLGSVAELAQFYGLDLAVISSAARFLESIGHLSRDGAGRLTLSDIGLQSVREGKRYLRELRDRRHLYFDGFTGQPLTRPFYDERTVTFLDAAGLARLVAEAGSGSRHSPAARDAFTLVNRIPPTGFGPEALSALVQMPAAERDRFNLPEQVISPSLVGTPEQVYLPAYVVRAVDAGGVVGYLAYTQASEEADPEWSQACAVAEEVAVVVENEYQSGRDEGEENAARRWVEKRYTGRFDVSWRNGLLVATVPARAFDGDGGDGLEPRRIGSFTRMDGWYFQVWCDDERLRYRALLDLTESYLIGRTRVAPGAAAKRLERFGRQVGFGPLTAAEIAKLARKEGRKDLAARLDKLTELRVITWPNCSRVVIWFSDFYTHRESPAVSLGASPGCTPAPGPIPRRPRRCGAGGAGRYRTGQRRGGPGSHRRQSAGAVCGHPGSGGPGPVRPARSRARRPAPYRPARPRRTARRRHRRRQCPRR
jgi:hypothetical protein